MTSLHFAVEHEFTIKLHVEKRRIMYFMLGKIALGMRFVPLYVVDYV